MVGYPWSSNQTDCHKVAMIHEAFALIILLDFFPDGESGNSRVLTSNNRGPWWRLFGCRAIAGCHAMVGCCCWGVVPWWGAIAECDCWVPRWDTIVEKHKNWFMLFGVYAEINPRLWGWCVKDPITWVLHKRHHCGTVATQELCGVHGHYDDGLSLPLRTWLSGMYAEMCSVDNFRDARETG